MATLHTYSKIKSICNLQDQQRTQTEQSHDFSQLVYNRCGNRHRHGHDSDADMNFDAETNSDTDNNGK